MYLVPVRSDPRLRFPKSRKDRKRLKRYGSPERRIWTVGSAPASIDFSFRDRAPAIVADETPHTAFRNQLGDLVSGVPVRINKKGRRFRRGYVQSINGRVGSIFPCHSCPQQKCASWDISRNRCRRYCSFPMRYSRFQRIIRSSSIMTITIC